MHYALHEVHIIYTSYSNSNQCRLVKQCVHSLFYNPCRFYCSSWTTFHSYLNHPLVLIIGIPIPVMKYKRIRCVIICTWFAVIQQIKKPCQMITKKSKIFTIPYRVVTTGSKMRINRVTV